MLSQTKTKYILLYETIQLAHPTGCNITSHLLSKTCRHNECRWLSFHFIYLFYSHSHYIKIKRYKRCWLKIKLLWKESLKKLQGAYINRLPKAILQRLTWLKSLQKTYTLSDRTTWQYQIFYFTCIMLLFLPTFGEVSLIS